MEKREEPLIKIQKISKKEIAEIAREARRMREKIQEDLNRREKMRRYPWQVLFRKTKFT